MLTILEQLLPIFASFSLGVLLRYKGLANRDQGDFLLRLVFFVCLPLLILLSVSQLDFTVDKVVLPLLNILVNVIAMLAAWMLGLLLKMNQRSLGTLLVGTAIVNNAFMFPFTQYLYGDEGFADAILWDFGNALFMSTVVYVIAFRYGGEHQQGWGMLLKILKSPLVWSLLVSVGFALTYTRLPLTFVTMLSPLAQLTSPLILIGLGILSSPRVDNPLLSFSTIGLRMALGLLVGIVLATAFGLEGNTFKVVALCSGAPIGFNAVTLCSMSKLDAESSASATSISVLLGLIWIPLLALFIETIAP